MALGSKVSCLGCRQKQCFFFSWSCLWRWNETEALLWLFIWKHHQKTFACVCLCVQEEKGSPSNVFFEWISRDVTALMTRANSKSKYSNTALRCHLLPPSPTGTSGEVSQLWSGETFWRLSHQSQDPGWHLGTCHSLLQLLSFKCAPSEMESPQWWMQNSTSAAACTPSMRGAQLPRQGMIIREVWFNSWLCKVLIMSF